MFLLIHVKNVVVPDVSHDRTIILEIHVDYVFAPEVSYDRAMFLVFHVDYFIVPEVSHDPQWSKFPKSWPLFINFIIPR